MKHGRRQSSYCKFVPYQVSTQHICVHICFVASHPYYNHAIGVWSCGTITYRDIIRIMLTCEHLGANVRDTMWSMVSLTFDQTQIGTNKYLHYLHNTHTSHYILIHWIHTHTRRYNLFKRAQTVLREENEQDIPAENKCRGGRNTTPCERQVGSSSSCCW